MYTTTASWKYTQNRLPIEFYTGYLSNSIVLQATYSNSFFMLLKAMYRYKQSTFLFELDNPIVTKIITTAKGQGIGFIYTSTGFYNGRPFPIGYTFSFGKTKHIDHKTKNIENNDLKIEKRS